MKFSKENPISHCKCATCQEMCSWFPCKGTPREIQRLIDVGYGDRLMLEYHDADKIDWREDGIYLHHDYKTIYFVMPAVKGLEGKLREDIGDEDRDPCTFFKKGLCEINGLKPMEGKRVSHAVGSNGDRVRSLIFFLWSRPEGKRVLESWKAKFYRGEKTVRPKKTYPAFKIDMKKKRKSKLSEIPF